MQTKSETGITTRMKEFIRYFGNAYTWIENVTDIEATKWRDLERGKTKEATAMMIDAFCRVWPEFAYWLVTGNEASSRGQLILKNYFGVDSERIGSHEWGVRKVYRDENMLLQPLLGNLNIQDRKSKEYEISVAERILRFSGFANIIDGETLAEKFWFEFFMPMKPGGAIYLSEKHLKDWVNQFPANKDYELAELEMKSANGTRASKAWMAGV